MAGLNVEQVLRLHNLTKDVSELCERQLKAYVNALAPLFRPRRLLGDYIEGSGKEGAGGVEENLTALKELFQRSSVRPIDLHTQLSTPIESIPTQLQVHPWQYVHEVAAGIGRKRITVTSPLTWVVSYPGAYSLSMFRQVILGEHERDRQHIQSFVLRACIMSLMFEKVAGLKTIFEGLRYRIEIRKSRELGELPLVTVSAPFPSIRPADEIVLLASGVSGGKAFEEVLDLDAARNASDPLKDQVNTLLATYAE